MSLAGLIGLAATAGLSFSQSLSFSTSLAAPVPTLSIDFTSGTLDSRITFSRASTATYFDSTGKLTYAPNNQQLHSQDIGNVGAWTLSAATITSNAIAAPDGTTTAEKLIETAATAQHYIAGQSFILANGRTVFSVYAKAAERSRFYITMSAGATLNQTNAQFNLATGTVVGTTNTFGWSLVSAAITAVGDGWYRCSLVVDTAGSAYNPSFSLALANDTGTLNYAGDGVSGLYLWGAQAERVTYETTPRAYNATTASAYYGPRFDYDPSTLAARGLLIEEQRTNKSSNYNANPTDLTAVSAGGDVAAVLSVVDDVAALAAAGLSGFNGKVLKLDNTLGVADARISINGTAGTVNPHTISGYVRGSGTVTPRVSGTGVGATSTALTSSYQRVTSTQTPSATSNVAWFSVGAGATLYLTLNQYEEGSFATSPIIVAGAQVTRSADVATITGANFSGFYNQAAGTIVAEVFCPVALGSGKYGSIVQIGDGTASNRIDNGRLDTNSFHDVFTAGVAQSSFASTFSLPTGAVSKSAYAFAVNDQVPAVNGVLGTVDTTAPDMPVCNQMRIGYDHSSRYFNGHIRRIRYYPQRLANSQLQALTA